MTACCLPPQVHGAVPLHPPSPRRARRRPRLPKRRLRPPSPSCHAASGQARPVAPPGAAAASSGRVLLERHGLSCLPRRLLQARCCTCKHSPAVRAHAAAISLLLPPADCITIQHAWPGAGGVGAVLACERGHGSAAKHRQRVHPRHWHRRRGHSSPCHAHPRDVRIRPSQSTYRCPLTRRGWAARRPAPA